MDDTQRIVKCGALSLLTAGGFFKKKWQPKYLVLYDGSKSGVKRLELFDSEIKFKKQNPAKIIPLVDCVRVVTCQRNKTTYTFEVRTIDQFYLLAAQSFQDMNDWVNCLRLVAFGEPNTTNGSNSATAPNGTSFNKTPTTLVQQQANKRLQLDQPQQQPTRPIDVLLDDKRPSISAQKQPPSAGSMVAGPLGAGNSNSNNSNSSNNNNNKITTASQAAAAAANAIALAKTRQRQPSLLGSCKPQPPTDSPFIKKTQALEQIAPNQPASELLALNKIGGQIDTMTPTVRGQLIGCGLKQTTNDTKTSIASAEATQTQMMMNKKTNSSAISKMMPTTLDEEEENMLYCSIEDNPSEHNYRVKVIESELSLRCQLKCYQLTSPIAVSQQYEQIGNFNPKSGAYDPKTTAAAAALNNEPITFYQLIIGPQELTLLNDYAINSWQSTSANKQQQGLWSWPYQCIRRYGFDKDNCFMFEAGRKCTSGPGQFIVQTPKAYSIYQDVVKFVNELRCVSSNDTSSSAINGGNDSKQPNGLSITQIPVTWTKPIMNEVINLPNSDPKQQFFDSLKQFDPKSERMPETREEPKKDLATKVTENNNSSSSRSSTMSSINKTSQLEPQASSPIHRIQEAENLAKNNTNNEKATKARGDLTSEETDESGYDQGDDSVDSQSNQFKPSSSATSRLRDSMSSSSMSSLSNPSSTGSSPGHSVGRCSKGASNTNGSVGSDRALVLRKWPPTSKQHDDLNLANTRTSNTEKLLGRLISTTTTRNGQDFEANLIRDVYSEITKLHATFAVTTSDSHDDSLSSGSSSGSSSGNEGGSDSDRSQPLTKTVDEDIRSEPMYTNVREHELDFRPKSSKDPRCLANNLRQQQQQGYSYYEQGSNMCRTHLQSNSNHEPASYSYGQNHIQQQQQQFHNHAMQARCGSIYPSILNPIPECAEIQQQQQQQQQDTRKQSSKLLKSTNMELANQFDSAIKVNKPKGATSQQQLRSRLPTNHYLINDVQYAKISRNSNNKHEFCL